MLDGPVFLDLIGSVSQDSLAEEVPAEGQVELPSLS
jgi:hypothetical protein